MDLSEHVENIRRHFAAAADTAGEEARALAERLFTPLEAAIRLSLQDVLADAAQEITCELAPGSVELRLHGRQPEFVVTPARPEPSPGAEDADLAQPGPVVAEGDERVARLSLRIPEHLKARVDDAAEREGISVNSWLIQAAAAALERGPSARPRERWPSQGSKRYTGWSR
ncbi:MAG TPA: toxin-antitoxin system HicB family antitoxin [Acidimicrobiales bacterium]|nr:toxin-antitoxin system HicB family antitoxin [Acidimicrobiales bacterium]